MAQVFLSSDEVHSIERGEFRVDCVKMLLRQRQEVDPIEIAGAGTISQDQAGHIDMALYGLATTKIIALMNLDMQSHVGAILPDSRYFDLEAVDITGRRWLAERVFPHVAINASMESGTARARLRQIRVIGNRRTKNGHALSLYMPTTLRIPANARTETVIQSALGDVRSGILDTWIIAGLPFECVIAKQGGGIRVECKSHAESLPVHLDTRIEEALWFVLGGLVHWTLLTRFANDQGEIIVRSVAEASPARGTPPIAASLADGEESRSELFRRYVVYVNQYDQPRYHPLSVIVKWIIRASSTSVEDHARAVTVSLETLIQKHCAPYGAEPATVIEEIAKIEEAVRALPMSRAVGRRVRQALRRMKSASSRTALRGLVGCGLLTTVHREAWEQTRHVVAHGVELDDSVEDVMVRCDQVGQAVTMMILALIGYEGYYTDYASTGWPVRKFARPEGLSMTASA